MIDSCFKNDSRNSSIGILELPKTWDMFSLDINDHRNGEIIFWFLFPVNNIVNHRSRKWDKNKCKYWVKSNAKQPLSYALMNSLLFTI